MDMRETMSTRTIMVMPMATIMSLGMGMTTADLAGCKR
jgi:hypothetical protein